MDDGANSHYHGMKLSADHRFSGHFTILTSYTYSRCTQSSTLIGNRLLGPTYQNPRDRDADHGPCDADLPHNFVSSFVSEMPHYANKWINGAFSDWQLAFLVQVHSGFPFDALTGADASLSGVGLDRPNLVGDPYLKNLGTLQWLNPAAFVRNDPGTFGNLRHNALRGPGFFNTDASLTRLLRIGAHRVEFRAEFFNILNHTNFNPPVTNLQSANFGRIQSADDPRIIQFGIKYAF
jgi:hypothetical protein